MTPRVSFVVAARNDDHGGNFLVRMQTFVTTLTELMDGARLASELLVVEWNAPSDRAELVEAVRWPRSRFLSHIRIIRVSPALHATFPKADEMPMFEYRAKNVGIRRAEGAYVLATNPDLVFTPALVRRLAGRLDHGVFYRVNRHDVRGQVPQGDLRQVIAYCRANTTAVNSRYGTLRPRRTTVGVARRSHYARLMLRAAWGARASGLRPLHTNAAGDFFLMSRDRWHELRGYPELSSRSFLDGSMLVLAKSSGLRQVVLRPPIYHQEHVVPAGRQLTSYEMGHLCAEWIDYRQHTTVMNSPDWGLGATTLQEEVVKP